LGKAFKAHGFHITPEQWGVLNCLWEEDGQTQTEIAERILKDKTNLTRMLDIMEREELLERRPHEKDRRSYRIYLTLKGEKLKENLIPIAMKINKVAIQSLILKEREVFKRLMNTINRNLG